MTSPASSRTVTVPLGERTYDIIIGQGELSAAGVYLSRWVAGKTWLNSPRPQAFLVTDRNVLPHARTVQHSLEAAGWTTETMTLEPGEKTKNLDVIAAIYDRLVDFQADRRTLLVAVGGGVIGDAAGFAAASFNRGLPFVQIPTTLLAHVDSSVGGKVGINHPRGKNLIGAFHQPLGVLIDTATLDTMPDREFRSGLAEVVKYGVILDEEFFNYIHLEAHTEGIARRKPEVMQHIIARSCELKAQVVEQDEYERTGLRAVLNYGHTFCHAFENLAGYGELLHGEAVAIGMIYASRLAEKRGLIKANVTASQIAVLKKLGLPTRLPDTLRFPPQEILDSMKLDKKTVGGQLRFVLPTRIGEVKVFSDCPETQVRELLEELGG